MVRFNIFLGLITAACSFTGMFIPLGAQTVKGVANLHTSSVPNDTAILQLFDHPADLRWIRYFRGRLDDVSSIQVALGYDGKHCKGYFTYPRSNTRLKLEGSFDSSGFRLQERLPDKQITGYLHGRFTKSRMLADWSNADRSLGGRLEADEAPYSAAIRQTEPCNENKWSGRYIGRWNGGRADLILNRIYNGELRGYIWIESDGRSCNLRGQLQPNGTILAEVFLPNGTKAAQIQGKLVGNDGADFTWVGGGEIRDLKFTLREQYSTGCLEYADFFSSYDALYPRTNCANCNQWLDSQFKQWADKCLDAFANQKKIPAPDHRNTQRASAWTEVSCWTENIFTGYLTFDDTWTQGARGMAFNFDLRTGRFIGLAELFQKSFNAEEWLQEYARKEMPKLPVFAADPRYREWLSKTGFPLFTLRRDGMELSTTFHPDYGRQLILIPYSILKPYLKRDNPIADLVR